MKKGAAEKISAAPRHREINLNIYKI